MLRIPILAVCLVALTLPLPAAAQQTNAPPGNSGIDEYFETMPGAGGNRGTNQVGSKPGGARLPTGVRSELSELGPEGRAASEAAETTGPPARELDTEPADSSQGRSATEELGRVLTGSETDGMGLALPLILTAALLAAAGVAVMRRRRST